MKKLLLITGFCCSLSLANAQESTGPVRSIQDSHHNVIGYFRDGAIFDKDNKFIGQYKSENQAITVVGSQHTPVGYIIAGKEVQDGNRKTVGYIKENRSDNSIIFEDAQHATVGTVKIDGSIVNNKNSVVGYNVKTEPVWAGLYFFLLKF